MTDKFMPWIDELPNVDQSRSRSGMLLPRSSGALMS